MSNKTYILQHDLPDGSVKGDEYVRRGDRYVNKRFQNSKSPVIEDVFWFSWQVEKNTYWFKEKEEEQPKEKDTFVWSDELVKEFVISFNKIDKLITGVDPIGKTIIEWKQSKSTPKEDKTYTEKELLAAEQKAFEAARETFRGQLPYTLGGEKPLYNKYPKFSDYKNRVLNNDGKENFKNYL